MQLRVARLCLDCDEVHDAQHCPGCASEAFGYLTRWVPAPERRTRPRPTSSPEAELYKPIVDPPSDSGRRGRLWKRGLVGLTMIGVAGWLWQRGATAVAVKDEEGKKPAAE